MCAGASFETPRVAQDKGDLSRIAFLIGLVAAGRVKSALLCLSGFGAPFRAFEVALSHAGVTPWTIRDRHAPVAAASHAMSSVEPTKGSRRRRNRRGRARRLPVSPCAQDRPRRSPTESVPDLLRLPPDLYLGEVSGVALNSAGHIFRPASRQFDGTRHMQRRRRMPFGVRRQRRVSAREIGHNLYAWSFAHTVKVDREDNVWVTDKGSDMVIKFTPLGRVDMVFGRKQEALGTRIRRRSSIRTPRSPRATDIFAR